MRSFVILASLLAGCSEYDLLSDDGNNGDGDSDDTVDVDSGETTSDACPDQVFPGYVTGTDADCENEPETGTFTPVVEWAMPTFPTNTSANQVMAQPIVASVNDDNGDGRVDDADIPDVIVSTYYDGSWSGEVTIRAISGDGSRELWSRTLSGVQGMSGLAAADIDNDGLVEIAAVQVSGGIVVLENDGTVKYTSVTAPGSVYGISDTVAISDMDGDGIAEIIAGSAIFEADGTLRGVGQYGRGGAPATYGSAANVGSCSFAVDLDRDGVQEVITGNAAYRPDGTTKWYNGQADGYPAVGNFDSDPDGEIVLGGGGQLRMVDTDGTPMWTVTIPGGYGGYYYGGPPTVADFDGDGEPEIGVASGSQYSVFEKDGTLLWQAATQDGSSGNTGSAVFDFEGDGAAEVVYADETRLWVFDGATGAVKLQSNQHSNATWLEYSTIADVDGDGHAEIIVPNTGSGYYGSYTGITVFGDANNSWRPGRKMWNQYAYHITNVNDDGTIPRVADINWDTFNNFRSGDMLAGSGFSTVDLTIDATDKCEAECDSGKLVVWVNVGNSGAADLDVAASRGFVDLFAVINGSEQRIDSVPINGGTVVHGTYQESIQFDITGYDPTTFDSVIVRVRSQERDCNVANNEVEFAGPFCQ
jgi:hypothetical protein